MDEGQAVSALMAQVSSQAPALTIRGAILFASPLYNAAQLQEALVARLPGVPFVGLTSCLGTASSAAAFGGQRSLSGLFLLGDGFRVGVAAAHKGEDPVEVGRRLATEATVGGLAPRFAFFTASPGNEEELLAGVFQKLDPQLPILGGSAADNDLSGSWAVFTPRGMDRSGAALLVCDWPWRFAVHYQGGYMPSDRRGVVTRAQGRTVYEIDGQPAAQVYDGWLKNKLASELKLGGNILAASTLTPLGIVRADGGTETYLLAHPEGILNKEHALTVFTQIHEGEVVVLMRSSPTALVQRGANVALRALEWSRLMPAQVQGALLIYCGGCLLGIQDRAAEMLERFSVALGGRPYVAGFCFGEQGCVVPGRPEHGNLMSSALLLTTEPE